MQARRMIASRPDKFQDPVIDVPHSSSPPCRRLVDSAPPGVKGFDAHCQPHCSHPVGPAQNFRDAQLRNAEILARSLRGDGQLYDSNTDLDAGTATHKMLPSRGLLRSAPALGLARIVSVCCVTVSSSLFIFYHSFSIKVTIRYLSIANAPRHCQSLQPDLSHGNSVPYCVAMEQLYITHRRLGG